MAYLLTEKTEIDRNGRNRAATTRPKKTGRPYKGRSISVGLGPALRRGFEFQAPTPVSAPTWSVYRATVDGKTFTFIDPQGESRDGIERILRAKFGSRLERLERAGGHL